MINYDVFVQKWSQINPNAKLQRLKLGNHQNMNLKSDSCQFIVAHNSLIKMPFGRFCIRTILCAVRTLLESAGWKIMEPHNLICGCTSASTAAQIMCGPHFWQDFILGHFAHSMNFLNYCQWNHVLRPHFSSITSSIIHKICGRRGNSTVCTSGLLLPFFLCEPEHSFLSWISLLQSKSPIFLQFANFN